MAKTNEMAMNQSKAETDVLFERAADALQLFSENAEALRAFVNSLKKGNFSEARAAMNASLEQWSEKRRAAGDAGRVPSGGPKK
jgi:hypothetical protein